jgi:hypothetical protein
MLNCQTKEDFKVEDGCHMIDEKEEMLQSIFAGFKLYEG